MFLHNAWYIAAARDEVGETLLARTLLNEPIVLGRDRRGTLFALEDRCCHRGAPLSCGWFGERGLMCGYHGLEFDHHGFCIHVPGNNGRTIEEARVRAYPVAQRGDFVWIWMGAPARANVDEIIGYPPDDPTMWSLRFGNLYARASYVLLLENLMDLSHLSYVHRNNIGSSQEDSANAKTEVQKTPTGVRFLRLMMNAKPAPSTIERYGFTGNVDRWSDFEFVAPSLVIQYSGAVNAGDYEKGLRTGGHVARILHAITPETETTCHYFFSMAQSHGASTLSERESASTRIQRVEAFEEDVAMIEQQQSRLQGYDQRKLVNIPSDVVRVHMARFLEARVRQERSNASVGNGTPSA
jgi:phenylpropionate dioxygenase-like ring-hydroxylating dioxygenase large terminal subunit